MFCGWTHLDTFFKPSKGQCIGITTFSTSFEQGVGIEVYRAFSGPGSFHTFFQLISMLSVFCFPSTHLHPLRTPEAEPRQHQPALSSSGFQWVWPMRSFSRRLHMEDRAPKGLVPQSPLQNLHWLAASCHQWSHSHKVALRTASLSLGFVL